MGALHGCSPRGFPLPAPHSPFAHRSDMLGNLRLAGTDIVVEIQVTTTSMLRLKNSAAHGVYRIGRESPSPHGEWGWLGLG